MSDPDFEPPTTRSSVRHSSPEVKNEIVKAYARLFLSSRSHQMNITPDQLKRFHPPGSRLKRSELIDLTNQIHLSKLHYKIIPVMKKKSDGKKAPPIVSYRMIDVYPNIEEYQEYRRRMIKSFPPHQKKALLHKRVSEQFDWTVDSLRGHYFAIRLCLLGNGFTMPITQLKKEIIKMNSPNPKTLSESERMHLMSDWEKKIVWFVGQYFLIAKGARADRVISCPPWCLGQRLMPEQAVIKHLVSMNSGVRTDEHEEKLLHTYCSTFHITVEELLDMHKEPVAETEAQPGTQ
eukprot:gnl/Dysnectes_brevis/2747_a3341_1261.p1 GENE.gnl/Dysnectes_brevis/2747_a3341_1261~~gnl/Dysnectes_brevis/2747_a3341_1261.p1  ORF type:complete len:302 (+),score=15.96 gnl/Dysnectes_brevis/2747_a3341_1261:35-907(+)